MNRYVVVGRKGKRRVFTDPVDAFEVAKKCSRNKRGSLCRVCEGPRGSEKLVVVCAKNKCTKPHPKQPKMCFPRAPLRHGDAAVLGGARKRKRR